MGQWGCLRDCRYLLHDRDAKFCQSFRELIESGSVKPIRLPARSPNLNSFVEQWVRSVKEECLSKLILLGESSLPRALQQYIVHYHARSGTIRAKKIEDCFPSGESNKGRGNSALPGATGWPAEILRAGGSIEAQGQQVRESRSAPTIKDAWSLALQRSPERDLS